MNVPSPYYYVDSEGNRNRLFAPPPENQRPKKTNDKTEQQNIIEAIDFGKVL
jgi:hypothetical protein